MGRCRSRPGAPTAGREVRPGGRKGRKLNPEDRTQPTIDPALWELVRRTAAPWGKQFFLELTQGLAVALNVKFAAVSELVDRGRLRTLAVWREEEWGDEIEYQVARTPCGVVVEEGRVCFYGEHVQQLFPHDPMIRAWGVESYVGAPLKSSAGKVIGNLCLLDRKPIRDEARTTAILGPFAARAAAELDRIQTERELERQRAFLRQVLDINPSLIFAKDREGRFTLVNRSVADAYGTTIDGLMGKTDADFNPNSEEVAFFRKMDLEVMDTGRDLFIPEEPLTDSSGRTRWVQTIKRPMVGPGGQTQHVLGVATDITELKRMREDLLDRQRRENEKVQAELEKAKSELVRQTRLAAIGQVAASIAHELRNPLGSITNAVFYLSRRAPQIDPKWSEHLAIIVQEAHRADQIIGNLLEMSRPKAPAKERLDLGSALRETLERLRGAGRVDLEIVLDPDPFFLEADAGQFRQVVSNLFTNAIQAMDGKGRIRVRASRSDRWDRIQFGDDGPGIPPESRELVFEPLFTTKSKGTGLGLSICRQILDAHGGSIRIADSERGAVFEVRLPRVTAPPQNPAG